MGPSDKLLPAGKVHEIDAEGLLKAAGAPNDADDDDDVGDGSGVNFRELLGKDCVIKRVDKDRNVLATAEPEEMQHEMMTRAAAQKRLGACADHVKSMGREEKLNWALELKDRANDFYNANNFEEAAKLYNDCLVALDLDGSDEQRRVVETRLQLPVCTNLAACMIEMGQYSRCIEICSIALDVDSTHAKASYRRGLAYYRLGNHASARPDFEVALRSIEQGVKSADSEDSGDKEWQEKEAKSLEDLKRRVVVYLGHIRRFNVREKESCQRMFEKTREDGKDIYADRPVPKAEEEVDPAFDDSDEALDAALERIRADWSCCPCCRRRAHLKKS